MQSKPECDKSTRHRQLLQVQRCPCDDMVVPRTSCHGGAHVRQIWALLCHCKCTATLIAVACALLTCCCCRLWRQANPGMHAMSTCTPCTSMQSLPHVTCNHVAYSESLACTCPGLPSGSSASASTSGNGQSFTSTNGNGAMAMSSSSGMSTTQAEGFPKGLARRFVDI